MLFRDCSVFMIDFQALMLWPIGDLFHGSASAPLRTLHLWWQRFGFNFLYGYLAFLDYAYSPHRPLCPRIVWCTIDDHPCSSSLRQLVDCHNWYELYLFVAFVRHKFCMSQGVVVGRCECVECCCVSSSLELLLVSSLVLLLVLLVGSFVYFLVGCPSLLLVRFLPAACYHCDRSCLGRWAVRCSSVWAFVQCLLVVVVFALSSCFAMHSVGSLAVWWYWW